MIRTGITALLILFQFLSYAQEQSRIYQFRFERNSYELSGQNRQILSLIADSLVQKRNFLIYINGHADSDADSSYNQRLSLNRSLAVKDFLAGKGINESLIRVQALGEDQPLVANRTPLEKARNRRVELMVVFQQTGQLKEIQVVKEDDVPGCEGDTTVTLEDDYVLTLSKCDWQRNSQCLRIEKRLDYKFTVKENWLKKHIGFKNYQKTVTSEPHYEFYVTACRDSCFKKPVKLYIPHYQAPSLQVGVRFSQKKNDKGGAAALTFRKAKLGDSAYYVANILCPGMLNCSFDGRCSHPIDLYAKRNTSILSYSYYLRGRSARFDSLVRKKPANPEHITDDYKHAFFNTLEILNKGETTTINSTPIDVFPHGLKKRKIKGSEYDKRYFLFIPYRKKYWCGHYMKYKIRPKDIERLKNFRLTDLRPENWIRING